jgi:hypothetical protein
MKEDQALIDAGIEHATAVIVCSNDDVSNLEVAIDSRRMNPKVRIVLRLFDQQLAAWEFSGSEVLRYGGAGVQRARTGSPARRERRAAAPVIERPPAVRGRHARGTRRHECAFLYRCGGLSVTLSAPRATGGMDK